MSEKKQLNDEELEKVSGGDKTITTTGDISKYSEYTIKLGDKEPVQGQRYLFKTSLSDNWLFGILSNKYNHGNLYIYDVKVEDGYMNSTNIDVSDWETKEVNTFKGWSAYNK